MLFTTTAPTMSIQNRLTALTVRGASNLSCSSTFETAPLDVVSIDRFTRDMGNGFPGALPATLITGIRGYSRA